VQEGWCDSRGTLEDVKAKIQMRQEGAFKRERAIAYSLAQKVRATEFDRVRFAKLVLKKKNILFRL